VEDDPPLPPLKKPPDGEILYMSNDEPVDTHTEIMDASHISTSNLETSDDGQSHAESFFGNSGDRLF